MSDAPVAPRFSDAACSLIGGAITGILLAGIMVVTMCTCGHLDKLPHMWFLGIVFGVMSGMYCNEHFQSVRCVAIVSVLTFLPFALCSIVAVACSCLF